MIAFALLLLAQSPAPDAPPPAPPATAPATADGDAATDSGPATATTTTEGATAATGLADADGWHVVSVSGEPHLPDGRPTQGACGWEQDVIVERAGSVHAAGADLKRAVYAVPCVKDDGGALVAGPPRVRLMADTSPRPLRDSDVQQAIESHDKAVAECQRRDPAGRGLLNLHWSIDPTGRPVDIAVRAGTLKSDAIARCVVAEIQTWDFPKHAVAAGVPVDYAFGFDGSSSPVNEELGRPRCKPGEKPKDAAQLKEGEVACVELVPRPCAQGEEPLPADQMPAGELPCKEMASDRGVPFLKGELTHFGDVQLTNPKSSVGVRLGVAVIDNVYFAQAEPNLNLHYGDFSLGLGAPLRFEIADLTQLNLADPSTTGTVFANAGRFRTEDWDQIEDFLRPLRFITYGKKEDRLFVDVNRVHAVTIGHGQLVRRYQPNIDIDEDKLIAEVDGYTDVGGVELMAGPFPVPRVVGGLVFVKPLGAFVGDDDTLQKSWSIGATYVTDLNAPTALEKRLSPADGRVQLAVDPSNQLVWRGRENPVGDMVQGAGLDTELKVFKNEFLDVKTYVDYSQLFFPADSSAAQAFPAFSGGGATVGTLLRMSFGRTPVRPIEDESDEVRAGRKPREMKAAHALRVRVEGRAFDAQYLPSYFNTMYEIDRLQYGFAEGNARGELPTKIAFLAAQKGQPLRLGYYVEASYDWVDVVGITAVYEDAYAAGQATLPVTARNFALHAETTGLGFLQLFATYHYRNFDDFKGLFSFSTDNEILYMGGRIELLPFLFINAAAERSFRVGFDNDDLAKQVDAHGNRFSSIGFENVWASSVDVELGWQF